MVVIYIAKTLLICTIAVFCHIHLQLTMGQVVIMLHAAYCLAMISKKPSQNSNSNISARPDLATWKIQIGIELENLYL